MSEYSGSTWGNLYVGPEPLAAPPSLAIHWPAGDPRLNAVVVPVSSNAAHPGTISITFFGPSRGSVQAAFWMTGYFVAPSS